MLYLGFFFGYSKNLCRFGKNVSHKSSILFALIDINRTNANAIVKL